MQGSYTYYGSSHKYYKYKETYTLDIWKTILGRIGIAILRGKASHKAGSTTYYKDQEAFEADWEKREER